MAISRLGGVFWNLMKPLAATALAVKTSARQLVTSAPLISSGSGAASASDPNGSLYLRTGGAPEFRVGGAWASLSYLGGTHDLNGLADGLVLDADGDTTISAPTDDQIDIEISGADDFQFTANTFTALSGSTIAAASGATVSVPTGATLSCGGAVNFTDGTVFLLSGNGTSTGDVVQRFGSTNTEGLELRVYEESITPAAVSTNALNVPAGSVLLSVQTNVETALVAGGTSVTLSIGPVGDPDKYGTHSADSLAKNQKIDTIPAHAVLGSAEQIQIHAAATGGAAVGDSAFSAGVVRVRIAYYALNSLDNAA